MDWAVRRILGIRLWEEAGKAWSKNVGALGLQVLLVSQFTLFADCRKGRRPSFTDAGRPDHASPLCDYFADKLKQLGVTPVATGRFGAHMQVDLCNDGPVTVWLDSRAIGASQ